MACSQRPPLRVDTQTLSVSAVRAVQLNSLHVQAPTTSFLLSPSSTHSLSLSLSARLSRLPRLERPSISASDAQLLLPGQHLRGQPVARGTGRLRHRRAALDGSRGSGGISCNLTSPSILFGHSPKMLHPPQHLGLKSFIDPPGRPWCWARRAAAAGRDTRRRSKASPAPAKPPRPRGKGNEYGVCFGGMLGAV